MNSVGAILETGHDALHALCLRCHVRRLDLFGSAVTDRFDPLRSDVDMLVEFTDLIFAIDSIPAIFGVTTDPFIVFTSNIFAVMGLRSLYFLLAAVVDRFHLLKYGLAIILSFVGFKMLTEKFISIDIALSLAIILSVLALSIVASMVWPQRDRGGSQTR